MDDAEPFAQPRAPRPTAVRVGAAVAALALAVAVPVLFVLGAMAPKRFQPLIGTLLVVSIVVPIALWFLTRSHGGSGNDESPNERGT